MVTLILWWKLHFSAPKWSIFWPFSCQEHPYHLDHALGPWRTNDHCRKSLRRTIERHKNNTQEHERIHACGRQNSEKRVTERDPCILLVTPLPPAYVTVSPISQRTRMRMLGSVVLVGLTRLCSDFCSWLSRLYVDFRLHAPEKRAYLILVVSRNFF